jgi:hypothetical protein
VRTVSDVIVPPSPGMPSSLPTIPPSRRLGRFHQELLPSTGPAQSSPAPHKHMGATGGAVAACKRRKSLFSSAGLNPSMWSCGSCPQPGTVIRTGPRVSARPGRRQPSP